MTKRKIRISYKSVQEKIYEKYNGNIIMLTNEKEYKGTHYKSKFKCLKCENEWEITINKILCKSYKDGCLICCNKRKKPQKLENIKKEIKDRFNIQILTNDEILIKSYKYNFLCNKCGFIWESELGNILNQKNACIKCSKGHYHYNLTEVKEMLLKNHHNKIEICDESYISISKPSKFKCNICDYEWSVKTQNVVNGFNGCPSCKRSQGERFIKTFLNENKIDYKEQFTFDQLIRIPYTEIKNINTILKKELLVLS